jgi:hypothetical protein
MCLAPTSSWRSRATRVSKWPLGRSLTVAARAGASRAGRRLAPSPPPPLGHAPSCFGSALPPPRPPKRRLGSRVGLRWSELPGETPAILRPQTRIERREGGAVPLAGERRPAMAGDSKGLAAPAPFATARTAKYPRESLRFPRILCGKRDAPVPKVGEISPLNLSPKGNPAIVSLRPIRAGVPTTRSKAGKTRTSTGPTHSCPLFRANSWSEPRRLRSGQCAGGTAP